MVAFQSFILNVRFLNHVQCVGHQKSMFAHRGVFILYTADSHLSSRFAAALYRVLQALSVDFSNPLQQMFFQPLPLLDFSMKLPKILPEFSVKSSTSDKVKQNSWKLVDPF